MQHSIASITIPQPCNQDWSAMQPDAQGKFCSHCQKAVTDFTGLSDKEIITILSASAKVCGKFNHAQLINLNNELLPQYSPSFSWRKFSLAALFIGFVPFVKAQAKAVMPAVEQNPAVSRSIGSMVDTNVVYTQVTGIVLDSVKLTIPGVVIHIKGTNIRAITNLEGQFYLNIPESDSVTLVINSIGFYTKEVKINPSTQNGYTFEMKKEPQILGEANIYKK